MNTNDDSDIIRGVLAGKIAMYSLLVDKYKNHVFTLAYNIVCNREDAEEVAQDAFVKAYTALSSFKEQSSFSTWLYRIAANTALNKRKGKKFVIVEIDQENDEEQNDSLVLLLQGEEESNKKKLIQQAMQELRDEERICITLFYLNELSVKNIHELTGITVTYIKVLLHRGRKHLHEQLSHLLGKEMKNLL